MAKGGGGLNSSFNPITISLLASLLLILDAVANQLWGNPIELLTIGTSGALFGISLGFLLLGRGRFNYSLGVVLAFMYIAIFVIVYLTKLIMAQ